MDGLNLRDLHIGIIGGGVVGRATARSWLEHSAGVRVWDTVAERRTVDAEAEAFDTDLLFVCLPTPQTEGGDGISDSALLAFAQRFAEWGRHRDAAELPTVIVKSTMSVGTTERIAVQILEGLGGFAAGSFPVFHCPEFLTARCATVDACIPAAVWLGVSELGRFYNTAQNVADIFRSRFPGVPVRVVGSRDTELAKLCVNSFFATKVAAFNIFRNLAESTGADWENIRDLMLSDGRIAPNHTEVPGPDGRRGFGGECLPKDTAELRTEAAIRDQVAAACLLECVLDVGRVYRGD